MTEKIVTAITEYSPIEAALASIEKYRGLVVDVTTTQGMKEAKAAHREVAAPRIALEKTRVKLKADVLDRGRLIDGEAKRIAARIAEIENPLKDQIEAEERREQEAREEAIKAEQDRLAAEERARKEAEERRLAEERAKIEAENKRLADERAKLEAEQRASREKIEAAERAARMKLEEEARQEKLARQAREEVERVKRQAEEDRLRAERDAIEAKAAAERRAKEDAERRAREAKDAAECEQRRKAGELADADAMLDTFARAYGHLPRYKAVVDAIKALPVKTAKRETNV